MNPGMCLFQEIEMILKTVVDKNLVCKSLHSKHQGFEGWRQVTEILLTACPEDLLQGELRQTILFEILQDLLIKVNYSLDIKRIFTNMVSRYEYVVKKNILNQNML